MNGGPPDRSLDDDYLLPELTYHPSPYDAGITDDPELRWDQVQAEAGVPVTILDWSGRDGIRHWGGGMMRTCRTCQQPTLLLDDGGRPQHKTCAEREADPELAAAGPVRERILVAEITQPSLEAEALG